MVEFSLFLCVINSGLKLHRYRNITYNGKKHFETLISFGFLCTVLLFTINSHKNPVETKQ